MASTPDGDLPYVTSGKGVTPVSAATGLAGPPFRREPTPKAVAIPPDGKTLYVVSGAAGMVTPISVATGKPGAAISIGSHPAALAITR